MKQTNIPIFIVEDEPIIQMMIEHTLRELGYKNLFLYSDGETAVEESIQHHPELIFMDMVLAGQMDGMDTAFEIRQHSDAQIVFMTANLYLLDADPRIHVINPSHKLAKPHGMQDISSIVNELFPKAA